MEFPPTMGQMITCVMENKIQAYYKNGPGFVPSFKPTHIHLIGQMGPTNTQSHLNGSTWSTEYPTGVGTCPASSQHGPILTTCVMENQIQAYYKNAPGFVSFRNQLKPT